MSRPHNFTFDRTEKTSVWRVKIRPKWHLLHKKDYDRLVVLSKVLRENDGADDTISFKIAYFSLSHTPQKINPSHRTRFLII